MSDKSGRLIGAQDDSTCVKSVYLEANTLRETKTIIIVTARDKSKLKFTIFALFVEFY